MTPDEFQTYRAQLTRLIRTKMKVCDTEGCACGNKCVIWTAGLDADGYAKFTMKNKTHKGHHYVYKKLVGPIELKCETCDGEGGDCCDGTGKDPDPTIDHLCHPHRRCVTVDHLEVVTRSENSRRANIRLQSGFRRADHDGQ